MTNGKGAVQPRATIPGLWWKLLTGVLMAWVIYGSFYVAHGAVNFGFGGNPARIVFFHVPVAVLSYVAYATAAVYGILHLAGRSPEASDMKAGASMELGLIFCILATITGSIFAGIQWGRFWNWDPRETSIVVMLLLYGAYMALRLSLADRPDQRGRFCAVYTLVALVPATFLIWIVPRIPSLQSLHPTNVLFNPDNTSASYKEVLYPSFAAFIMLYVWLLQLRCRIQTVVLRREQ